MAPLFLDVSHTSHSRARTGVQRVVRALWRELGAEAVPVTFDPFGRAWRPIEPWEERNLRSGDAATGRGTHWPLRAQVRGRLRRLGGYTAPMGAPESAGVLVPEIFTAPTGRALPSLLAGRTGPRVALFHDALALQFPEFTPTATVARFPSYLRELLQFDGIAAVSEASRTTLVSYWKWLGVARTPPVVALPLGIDRPAATAASPAASVPTVLCVSTLEGRKNHAALLEACETLWAGGTRFQLRLIGLANRETGTATVGRIERLRAAGRKIRYDGPVTDPVLEQAYADCAFTIYPSVAEGFGLPVAESLLRGKPCLCRMDGALGEIARPGGCASIRLGAAADIATALHSLLTMPAELAALEDAARRRTFRTWSQYVAELRVWMKSLPDNA